MIIIPANQYALNNLEFKPMRRFGINSSNFTVYNSQGRNLGNYDPVTNDLYITPEDWLNHFSTALKKALED